MSNNTAFNNSKASTTLDVSITPAGPAREIAAQFAEAPGEYLTRREAASYIRTVLGRPFSFSTATKLGALGEFAQPAIWWGRRPLYTREGLRAWVASRESRTRPTRRAIHCDPSAQARPAASRKLPV